MEMGYVKFKIIKKKLSLIDPGSYIFLYDKPLYEN